MFAFLTVMMFLDKIFFFFWKFQYKFKFLNKKHGQTEKYLPHTVEISQNIGQC